MEHKDIPKNVGNEIVLVHIFTFKNVMKVSGDKNYFVTKIIKNILICVPQEKINAYRFETT